MQSPVENPDIPNIDPVLSALSVLTERHGAAAVAADESTAPAGGVKGGAVVSKENEVHVAMQRSIMDETSEEGSAEAETRDDDDGASGSHAATTPPRKSPEEAVAWCALPTVAEGGEGFEVAGILEELMGLDCSTFATSSDETKGGAKQRNEGSDVAVAAEQLKHDILKSLSKGYETVAEATETVAEVTEKTCFPLCQEMTPKVGDVKAQENATEAEEAKAQTGEAEKAEVEDSKNPSNKTFLGRTRSFPKPPAKMPAVPSPMSSFRRIKSHQSSPSQEEKGKDSDVSLATLDSLSKGHKNITETNAAGTQEKVAEKATNEDQEPDAKDKDPQADCQGEAASENSKKPPKIPRARSFTKKEARTEADRQGAAASQDLKKPPKIPRARSFPRKPALSSPMSSLRRIRSNQSSSSQLSSEKTDGVSKASLVASDDLAEGRETADSGTATGVQGKVAENVITKEKAAKDDDLDEELQADVDQAKAAVSEDSKKTAKSSVARSRSYPKTPLPMSSSRRIRSYQPSSSKQPSKDGNDVVLTMLGNLNKKCAETATETTTKTTAGANDDAFPDDAFPDDEVKAKVGEATQEKLPEDAPATEESKKSDKYSSLLSFLPFRRVAKEYETIAKATEAAIFPAVAAEHGKGAAETKEDKVENVLQENVAGVKEENAENESGVVPVAGAPSSAEAEKKPGNGDKDQGYECVMDGVLLRVCNASE